MSSVDFDEMRAKWLCFWCDEKYETGHKCRKKHLYLIEVNEGSDEERDLEGDNENDQSEEETHFQILVHAINGMGARGYTTMRVTAFIKKRPLHILIDSDSTHNFLDVEVAKRLGCKLEEV